MVGIHTHSRMSAHTHTHTGTQQEQTDENSVGTHLRSWSASPEVAKVRGEWCVCVGSPLSHGCGNGGTFRRSEELQHRNGLCAHDVIPQCVTAHLEDVSAAARFQCLHDIVPDTPLCVPWKNAQKHTFSRSLE